MTTISVLPNPTAGGPAFRAVTNGAEGTGSAPGEAIDALLAQAGTPRGTTVIILQPDGPDEFFPAALHNRLADLMTRWRAARDAGTTLAPGEQAELDSLVAAELNASAARSAAALRAVRP